MSVESKVKALIEQRIIEANKKDIAAKLVKIADVLGQPIQQQSIFNGRLPDVWALPGEDIIYDPERIYEADEDAVPYDIGRAFYGLKYGINLHVSYKFDEFDKADEIKASYNGYLVYAEIAGSIEAYAPYEAWESAMEMFYEGAKQLEGQKKAKERAEELAEKKRKWKKVWESLKEAWGF